MPEDTETQIQELREEVRRLREQRSDSPPQAENGNGHRPSAPPPAPKQPFIRAHPVGVVILLILLVALAIGGFFLWQYLQSFESTDDAQISGYVNAITPRISGTITAIHVVENQVVKKGDLLIELDSRDYTIMLERARAALGQAQASILAQQTSVPITSTSTETSIEVARSEIAGAEAGLASAQREHDAAMARLTEAQANNARAQADLARYRLLVAKDEVSHEEFDQRVALAASAAATVQAQQAAVAAAQKAIDQRQAVFAQARARLNQVSRNAPQEIRAQRASVNAQRAAAESARASMHEAGLNLEYTKIYAPVDGVVGRRGAEVGQRVQPGQQLLSIVQVNDIWVTANFKENQLRRMRTGQPATIHVDAFDRDYDGYVESMPAASAATFSVLPPENATGNYVKVVQRLPVRLRFKPDQDSQKQLRPGMSVEPKVWLR